jgi:site-specific DNA-methyltransferase (adenine-specific)
VTPVIDLRLGRWQDVLADAAGADLLVTDPPYSARTHAGQRTGSSGDDATIDYHPLTEAEARAIAEFWAPRVRSWAIIFCDHIAFMWHEAAWAAQGWLTFPPCGWVKPDAAPRKQGDGPQSSIEPFMVARRRCRELVGTGSRRGHYDVPTSSLRGCGVAGAKPLALMRAVLRDYSAPGQLVVDPYAGSGTTLIAAALEGCTAVGAEERPEVHAIARARIDSTSILPLRRAAPPQEQLALVGGR